MYFAILKRVPLKEIVAALKKKPAGALFGQYSLVPKDLIPGNSEVKAS